MPFFTDRKTPKAMAEQLIKSWRSLLPVSLHLLDVFPVEMYRRSLLDVRSQAIQTC